MLSAIHFKEFKPIIETNVFKNLEDFDVTPTARKVLDYYRISQEDAERWMKEQVINIQ